MTSRARVEVHVTGIGWCEWPHLVDPGWLVEHIAGYSRRQDEKAFAAVNHFPHSPHTTRAPILVRIAAITAIREARPPDQSWS